LINPLPNLAAGHGPPIDDLGKKTGDAIGNQQPIGDYAARMAIEQTRMQVEDRMVDLAPGMAVTVEIKTGQRRIIEYLLSPLLHYRHEAIRER
jgi:hemolysin D